MSVPIVALTGATGFIGRHLLKELPKRGFKVRVLLRRPTILPPEASGAVVGDLAAPRNMSDALAGVDAVVHSAGLAHGMSGVPEDDYRAINTEATVALARAAARAGARRFVFLSSIRAQSGPVASEVLTEDMEPRPTDAYGRSKLDAERGLADVHIDWVAMRPVLVYGQGVRGNMAALLKAGRQAGSASVSQFAGKAFPTFCRQFGGGRRYRAARRCAIAATVDRGRSRGAHDRRDDRVPAPGARA